MYGTELAAQRKHVLQGLVGEALGPARSGGIYWDEDEVLRLVDVGSGYAPHRFTARVFMWVGMLSAGVDPKKIETLSGYSAGEIRGYRLGQVLINPDQKARILAEVEKTVPETAEAGRYQPARQRFSGVDVSTTGGKPVPIETGKLTNFDPSV